MNALIEDARKAALEVLLHNRVGPFEGLPRTAGWGYPEPYTRDLLISALGILVSGNGDLIHSLERVMETLVRNQSRHGQIPSLVHDAGDRGASDTTPLFLLVLAMLRRFKGDPAFLNEAEVKALRWMDYQTTEDRELVGQLPTSDWRDEQWVLGYGLYVNSLVHGYQRLLGLEDRAEALKVAANRTDGNGFVTPGQPVFAIWFYKVLRDKRCDVLGNCLAILTGLADPERARKMIAWMEARCAEMRLGGELALDLPPCLFPSIQPSDPDWHARYEIYNMPGRYHNGGVWPFVCGFYVAALVAAGEQRLAEVRLGALTELIRKSRVDRGGFGFNEWFFARDGEPAGEDWQTWSASMYLYAAACVDEEKALFF
ncbi:MAG: hypothetical protein RLZZ214_455 [Verrucomicrobiota bacterium]|jgi:glycogen debranching enzyme